MKEKDVIKKLKIYGLKMKDFKKYMINKTVSVDENGETIYYPSNVLNFIYKSS